MHTFNQLLVDSPTSTMLLDLEQLVATLDIQYTSSLSPKSQKSSSSNDNLDDWEFWLKSKYLLEDRMPHYRLRKKKDFKCNIVLFKYIFMKIFV